MSRTTPARLAMALAVVLFPALSSHVWAEDGKMNVAPNDSFESGLSQISTNVCVFGGWFPVGVVTNDGTSKIEIVENVARTGGKSLRITPNPARLTGTIYYSQYNGGEEVRQNRSGRGVSGARTLAFRLDQDIMSLDAVVWVKKPTSQQISVRAIWYTRRNRTPFIKIAEQTTNRPLESKDGWIKYSLRAVRPHHARQVQIAIETEGDKQLCIDDVEVYFSRSPHVDILVDQLGYETKSGAKGIILQSSTALSLAPVSFSVIDLTDSAKVFKGKWTKQGYHRRWDLHHWVGDISALRRPGRYVVETVIGRSAHYSPPFEIRDDLLVPRTAELAYRFFYYQRCGTAVPSFHAACHLDDAKMPDGKHRDLTGGWHDAGDYNKYNGYTPESVYALAFAYDRRREFFDRIDQDANGRADILDEAIWGAKFLRKCIDPKTLEMIGTISSGYGYWGAPEKETDNVAATGDERPVRDGMRNASACTAGLALLGKYVPEYLTVAERLYEKRGGNMQAMLALHSATAKESYRQAARRRAESLLPKGEDTAAGFRELAEYALAFPEDALVPAIRSVGKARLEELRVICANPFGITRRRDIDGKFIFFMHYRDVNNWYVGESRELLDTAHEGILLDKLGFERGRRIAEDQVHWILGRNPYGVSTMEGVGSVFVPFHHHRYNALPGNPRGAVPGAILNGITRAWPDHDRPWLDMHPEPNPDYQPNEPWLPHNNRWLFLIAIW